MARGSLYETRHWLRRAFKRRLISDEQVTVIKPLISDLAPMLNAYLKSIGPTSDDNPATKNDQVTSDK
jgi:four helix bundle protein